MWNHVLSNLKITVCYLCDNYAWCFPHNSIMIHLTTIFMYSNMQRQCQLKYEAIGRSGWYAVALQIEDFASPTAAVPLSSVPVQFLVLVFSSDQPCSQKPEFVGVTRVAGSCIDIPFNTTFHEPLIAITGGPDVRCICNI